jgi:hypothetical protein
MKILLAAVAMTAALGTSAAAQTRLICQNSSREYKVLYEPGVSQLILNPDTSATVYPILIDDMTPNSHIVTASTPNGGPTARLHLRPYLKMEFWSDGQVNQTDGCFSY